MKDDKIRRMNSNAGFKLSIVALAVASLLAFVSCSKFGSSKVEVVYLSRATPDQLEVWEKLVSAFEKKHPGIKVRIENIPSGGSEYWTKLQVMTAGGTPPDVVFMESQRIAGFVSKDSIVDLTPLVQRDSQEIKMDDFFPQAINAYTFHGRIYGIPNDIAIWVVFYNKDALESAGLPLPEEGWTWNDLLEYARKLTVDKNGDGSPDMFGFYTPPWCYYLWIWQAGGDIFEDPMNPVKPIFNTSPVIRAVSFVHDLLYRYRVMPLPTDFSSKGPTEFFSAGKIAMMIDGHWMVPYYEKAITTFEWDVAPLPKDKRRANWAGGSAFCIMKGTKHLEEAWKFVKFATGEEGQKILVKLNFSTPARKSIAYSKEFLSPPPGHEEVFVNEIKYGRILPRHPRWLEMDDMIRNVLSEVWLDMKSPVDAAQQIQNSLQKIVQGPEI